MGRSVDRENNNLAVGQKPNAPGTFEYFLETEIPDFYDRGYIEVRFGEYADTSMGEGRSAENFGVGIVGNAERIFFLGGEPVFGEAENVRSWICCQEFEFFNFVSDGTDVEKCNLRFVVRTIGGVIDVTC